MLLLFLLVLSTRADLPVHCLRHQIVGKWQLEFTEPQIKGSGPLTCGHNVPDNERTSQIAGQNTFKKAFSYEVILTAKNNVIQKKRMQGKWTMVYDEGFEVDFLNYKCFAFSKYKTNYSGAYSYCGETLIGWYQNTETNERGCYRAYKVEKTHKVSEGANNGHVVQPQFFQYQNSGINKVWSRIDALNFVEQINRANLQWKAKAYGEIIGLTTKQLNRYAGRKKHSSTILLEKQKKRKQILEYDLSHLPKEFSWEKYLGKKIYEQKGCGSCYTISTMTMLSARLKIKGLKADLSPQQSIDCNYYNQGCDGGYPFLVEKYLTEQDGFIFEEKEYPYKGQVGECKIAEKKKRFRVINNRFIGGAYGKSNELNIMEELYKNGPVVLNFEPSFDFMFYVGGVFHSTTPDWIINGLAKPEWEKVDHSVLCYGWGEENGIKYWLLQNSWGKQWGENGRFRMKRGLDESSIESMAEAADIEIIHDS
ncbi:unnamed protein product [Paramecium sonneborni]|uniref:Dipeptidyl peptidase 1 n=1 Tax=Paramecium sonneborni TaxID=65129 RepID=A0A8S1R2K6_9CILI|nr:unnamed protein product [Paramecium sonneborni]